MSGIIEQDVDIIGYQVNRLGIMGGGIALQIKKKYSYVYKEYKKICNPINPKKNLGKCQIIPIKEGDKIIKINKNQV